MALKHAIARCNSRTPLACGADRKVFYSPKYDVIIKMLKPNGDKEQADNEKHIFENMSDKEREIFPIIDILEYQGKDVVIMKKCHSFKKYAFEGWLCHLEDIAIIGDRYNLSHEYDELLFNFIAKYELIDLHARNMGIMNNHLVILDAGY